MAIPTEPIASTAAPTQNGRLDVEEARAHLAAIVEYSQDAIVSKTLEGIILFMENAGAERLFGYAPHEAIGRHITLIIPPSPAETRSTRSSRG